MNTSHSLWTLLLSVRAPAQKVGESTAGEKKNKRDHLKSIVFFFLTISLSYALGSRSLVVVVRSHASQFLLFYSIVARVLFNIVTRCCPRCVSECSHWVHWASCGDWHRSVSTGIIIIVVEIFVVQADTFLATQFLCPIVLVQFLFVTD